MLGFLHSPQPWKAPREVQNPSFSSCFLHPLLATPQSGFSLFPTCVFMTGRLQTVIPLQQTMWHHQSQTRKRFPRWNWRLLCCEKLCRKDLVPLNVPARDSVDNYYHILLILRHVKTEENRHFLSPQARLVVQPESGRLEETNILFLLCVGTHQPEITQINCAFIHPPPAPGPWIRCVLVPDGMCEFVCVSVCDLIFEKHFFYQNLSKPAIFEECVSRRRRQHAAGFNAASKLIQMK